MNFSTEVKRELPSSTLDSTAASGVTLLLVNADTRLDAISLPPTRTTPSTFSTARATMIERTP